MVALSVSFTRNHRDGIIPKRSGFDSLVLTSGKPRCSAKGRKFGTIGVKPSNSGSGAVILPGSQVYQYYSVDLGCGAICAAADDRRRLSRCWIRLGVCSGHLLGINWIGE
jgi:hypothetical protein